MLRLNRRIPPPAQRHSRSSSGGSGGPNSVSDHKDVRTAGPFTIVLGVKPRHARPGADPSPNPTADPAGAGKDLPCSETPKALTCHKVAEARQPRTRQAAATL